MLRRVPRSVLPRDPAIPFGAVSQDSFDSKEKESGDLLLLPCFELSKAVVSSGIELQ